MTTSTAGKPLDLAQFEGHTRSGPKEWMVGVSAEAKPPQFIWIKAPIGEGRLTYEQARFLSAAPALLAECHRQREEIARLREALEKFANLDRSVNSDLWAIDTNYCDQARAALGRQE